jgi:hypothetical protein
VKNEPFFLAYSWFWHAPAESFRGQKSRIWARIGGILPVKPVRSNFMDRGTKEFFPIMSIPGDRNLKI